MTTVSAQRLCSASSRSPVSTQPIPISTTQVKISRVTQSLQPTAVAIQTAQSTSTPNTNTQMTEASTHLRSSPLTGTPTLLPQSMPDSSTSDSQSNHGCSADGAQKVAKTSCQSSTATPSSPTSRSASPPRLSSTPSPAT